MNKKMVMVTKGRGGEGAERKRASTNRGEDGTARYKSFCLDGGVIDVGEDGNMQWLGALEAGCR